MTKTILSLCALLMLSACLGPEGRNGCDKHGNCAGSDSAGTIWHELTNDIRRTDVSEQYQAKAAPSPARPLPERSTWKDFENRIGNKVTDGAYQNQGPAAAKQVLGADGPTGCKDTRIGSVGC